jgi:hypothetical protein
MQLLFPGETYVFTLSITKADGTNPSVTSSPQIQVVNARTGVGVFGSAQAMTLVTGTQKVYTYGWAIDNAQSAPDDYFAIVSYTADTIAVTGRYLEKIRVGSSYFTGKVALDLTVAKDATVAKNSTVAKATDLAAVNPDNSSVVLAIKAKTDNLPADPASTGLLTSVMAFLTDVRDALLGSQVVNKDVVPATLSLKRVADNSELASYTLTEDSHSTVKTKQ